MSVDNEIVEVTQADVELAEAIASALQKYQVAYSHDTHIDMSTQNRMWRVHENKADNPFDRNEWLGEFSTKAEANSLCASLRKAEAEAVASRHRLAAERAALGGVVDRVLNCMVGMEWPPQDGDRQIDEVIAAILQAPPTTLTSGGGE